MEGHCLEDVDYEKDSGVVVSKDLKVYDSVRNHTQRQIVCLG